MCSVNIYPTDFEGDGLIEFTYEDEATLMLVTGVLQCILAPLSLIISYCHLCNTPVFEEGEYTDGTEM